VVRKQFGMLIDRDLHKAGGKVARSNTTNSWRPLPKTSSEGTLKKEELSWDHVIAYPALSLQVFAYSNTWSESAGYGYTYFRSRIIMVRILLLVLSKSSIPHWEAPTYLPSSSIIITLSCSTHTQNSYPFLSIEELIPSLRDSTPSLRKIAATLRCIQQ